MPNKKNVYNLVGHVDLLSPHPVAAFTEDVVNAIKNIEL